MEEKILDLKLFKEEDRELIDNKIKKLLKLEFENLYKKKLSDNELQKYYYQKNEIILLENRSVNQESYSVSLGGLGESYIESILNGRVDYEYVGNKNHSGDFIVEGDIMLEVKNYKNVVDTKEVKKFYRDVNELSKIDNETAKFHNFVDNDDGYNINNGIKGGIMISLKSYIVGKDKNKKINYELSGGVPIIFIHSDELLSSEIIISSINMMREIIRMNNKKLKDNSEIILNMREINTGIGIIDESINEMLGAIQKFIRNAKSEISKIRESEKIISSKIMEVEFAVLKKYKISENTDMDLLKDILQKLNPFSSIIDERYWKLNKNSMRYINKCSTLNNKKIIIKFMKTKSIIKINDIEYEIIKKNKININI